MVMISKSYPFFQSSVSKLSSTTDKERKIVNDLQLEQAAQSCNFYKRTPKKVTATALCLGFWRMQDNSENSLRKWAVNTGYFAQDVVSKQGLNNRLSFKMMEVVKTVLKHALSLKLSKLFAKKKNDPHYRKLLKIFNNIFIQDSTVQRLPAQLCEVFKSSHSRNQQTASVRIQAIYNFTTETWVDFHVGSYTDNDQSQAMMITQVAQKDDLVLRDLGYFTLESLAYLLENQKVITKYHVSTNLYDKQSGEKIDLLELFENQREIDQPILLGSKKRLPMRLVAIKLPKDIAKKRVEEAKNDRHTKANHSQQYYDLLQWEIYLTNVEKEDLNPAEIAKVYGLRWYIEILFKAWKSYANFKTILDQKRMTYQRTVISIYLLLIRFVYYSLDIYHYIQQQVESRSNKLLSMFKFLDVCAEFSTILLNIRLLRELDPLIPQFIQHGTYEIRQDRLNMKQKYLYVNELRIKKS